MGTGQRNVTEQLVAACSIVPGDQLRLGDGRLVVVSDVALSSIDRSCNLHVEDIDGRRWVIMTSEGSGYWVVTTDGR